MGNTYISVAELRSCLDNVAGTKIVLLDCCYSGMCIDKVETPVDFDQLVIDVTLPTAETDVYHDMYIPEGDIQLVSWAGDFTISHLDLKEIAE